jgi:hypothetical protein
MGPEISTDISFLEAPGAVRIAKAVTLRSGEKVVGLPHTIRSSDVVSPTPNATMVHGWLRKQLNTVEAMSGPIMTKVPA